MEFSRFFFIVMSFLAFVTVYFRRNHTCYGSSLFPSCLIMECHLNHWRFVLYSEQFASKKMEMNFINTRILSSNWTSYLNNGIVKLWFWYFKNHFYIHQILFIKIITYTILIIEVNWIDKIVKTILEFRRPGCHSLYLGELNIFVSLCILF